LWEAGQDFLDRFNSLEFEVKIKGYPTRGAFDGPPLLKALLFQEAARACVLFGPSWFFNYQHPSDTSDTISCVADIVARINRGEVKLLGEMPASPFAERVRKNGN
jgi:hypothetical protein